MALSLAHYKGQWLTCVTPNTPGRAPAVILVVQVRNPKVGETRGHTGVKSGAGSAELVF